MTPDSEELAAFQRDGAVVMRNVVSGDWLARMAGAVERALAEPGTTAVDYTPRDRPGRFFNDFFLWLRDPDFRAFMRDSPLPELAAAFLAAPRVGIFFDQLFVKEPRTQEHMPWHQDMPYWPVRDADLVTIWVPLDPVTRESGSVVYAKGSHRWGRVAKRWTLPREGEAPPIAAHMQTEMMAETQFVYWDLQPGDVLIHHPLTVHASFANATPGTRRRALALRYYAEGCVFESRPDDILQNPRVRELLPPLELVEGEPIRGAAFPIVWPAEA
ncbi:phytanoyl-CoA dioxygenase family protein [Nannocystaceae bacterium ST9]